MKYSETLSLIKQKVDLLQQDIINNPLKYLKGDVIDERMICSNLLRDVEKCLNTPWIDQKELEDIIQNKKIKLICNKKKKDITYTLIDKRGKQITISNKIRAIYGVDESAINITFMLPIEGDYLDFSYLFGEVKHTISFEIDVTNLTVYLALTASQIYKESQYYGIVESPKYKMLM